MKQQRRGALGRSVAISDERYIRRYGEFQCLDCHQVLSPSSAFQDGSSMESQQESESTARRNMTISIKLARFQNSAEALSYAIAPKLLEKRAAMAIATLLESKCSSSRSDERARAPKDRAASRRYQPAGTQMYESPANQKDKVEISRARTPVDQFLKSQRFYKNSAPAWSSNNSADRT